VAPRGLTRAATAWLGLGDELDSGLPGEASMAWTTRFAATKTLVGRIRAGYDAMDPAALNQVVVDPSPSTELP